MEKEQKHIAIVGAGPVGSLLSIYLSKRGYRVSVFERRDDMRKSGTDAGRSINLALSTRGIRALEEVGLTEEIKKVAIPMHGRMMHDQEGNLSFLPYGKQGQYINSISRSGLNALLTTHAEQNQVDFFFRVKCTHVDFSKTSLTLELADGRVQQQNFDLIIGADGAFSVIRSAMQITDRFNYSQYYLDHGYKELHIPADSAGGFVMEKHALHIWPRESFMMIALPNPDGSFTCTLFYPFEGQNSFKAISDDQQVLGLFKEVFPDAVAHMPSVVEDYNTNPVSSLVTIKCFPWIRNKTLLIGDAAHAIVPFYGQGMNAGFEDCIVLNRLLELHADNWASVLPAFQALRKKDTDAIAELAFDNFIEMRDLVADPQFLLRKKIEAMIHQMYPAKWIPLYSMVTFHPDISYSEAYHTGQQQKKIMDKVMAKEGIAQNWRDLDLKELVDQLDVAV